LAGQKQEGMMLYGKSLFVFLVVMLNIRGYAQSVNEPESRREALEADAERKGSEPEDDSYELNLEEFSRHPLNLNTASGEELVQLHMLNAVQIGNFISYRKLLGPLLTLRELQAVPGWDMATIRELLPYIRVAQNESISTVLGNRWKGGNGTFLIRAAQVLEKSKGFEKPASPETSYYTGSAQKIFIRYTYNFKQVLTYGFSGGKDAGEPFFRGAQRAGFDFYSFHFFLRKMGVIQSLAIGDFTVSMGQGLIQWQSFSLTKSSQTLAIKREAAFIEPYHSAGEFNFHRGIGICLQKGKWQSGFIISSQKISTHAESDTAGGEDLFSSFQNSGLHRTPTEIANRNNTRQVSAGGNIHFLGNRFQLGFNWVHFQFSRPFQKRDEPYNLYSLKGNLLSDYSIDYSYTLSNVHLFGEIASDRWRHLALLEGALISLNENLDLNFLYRNISPGYLSLYSDAFTENNVPNNEKGFYTGLTFRPVAGLQANIFCDVFMFPWLKYAVDAPSAGRDFFIQLNFQPNKNARFTALYKNEMKSGNSSNLNTATHEISSPVKQRWRMDTNYKLSRTFHFDGRIEFLSISDNGTLPQKGFLGMIGIGFNKPVISADMGFTLFETDNYDTRIYAYEPDLIYNFSLPSYYGKGIHYFINFHRDLSRLIPRVARHFRFSGWLKWGQVFYRGVESIGSGLDEIPGNRRSELKAQVLIQWQ
jgi:hypothetical protein